MEKIDVKTHPLEDAKFVDPVSLIVFLSISIIGKLIVEKWINRKKGVLIDLRESPPHISHVENIKAGFLVIVDQDGAHKAYKLNKKMSKKELLAQFVPVLKDALPLIG
jgi:malate/lactate dehydrogenase